ncbi:MAG: hypothetical protein GY725_01365 [bacterium]|nr:hypothetical protein [bacterium]
MYPAIRERLRKFEAAHIDQLYSPVKSSSMASTLDQKPRTYDLTPREE